MGHLHQERPLGSAGRTEAGAGQRRARRQAGWPGAEKTSGEAFFRKWSGFHAAPGKQGVRRQQKGHPGRQLRGESQVGQAQPLPPP